VSVARIVIAVISVLCALTTEGAAQERPSFPEHRANKYVSNHVLVRFRPTAKGTNRAAAHAAVRGKTLRLLKGVEDLELVEIPSDVTVREAVVKYRKNANVLYAEPDYYIYPHEVIPNDPNFDLLWGLRNLGAENGIPGADIKATQAWSSTTGSSTIEIGVVDTGINIDHPDLQGNAVQGYSPISDDYGSDIIGHGTHVAGTIGARGNNGVGVTGVNWNVTMVPCKFIDFNGGSTSNAIYCLGYIAELKDHGHNIVATNNSWGGAFYSQALYDAIDAQLRRGILFIASAGNGGFDGRSDDNDVIGPYPAAYDLPNIISVAATDRRDQPAFFSNLGRRSVHLAAPGVSVYSTSADGNYVYLSGTSMAAPHVTGAVALLKAYDPTLDWRLLKNRILATVDKVPGLQTISEGRLNVAAALSCSNKPLSSRLFPRTDSITTAVGQPVLLRHLNINCGNPAGAPTVTVQPGDIPVTLHDDAAPPDRARTDGVYSATWTPTGLGTYTLAFPGGDNVTVHVLKPYTFSVEAGHYRNIVGQNLNIEDEEVRSLQLPFPIHFGSSSFDHLFISDDGLITFDHGFQFPFALPIPYAQTGAIVAPWWDDMLPLFPGDQNIFWEAVGTAPNRELVIEWRDVHHYPWPDAGTVKFQVVFSESSDDVLFNYADTDFGPEHFIEFNNQGGTGTVGIQVGRGEATQFSHRTKSLSDGLTLHWTPGGPDFALSLTNADYTLFSQQSIKVTGQVRALRGFSGPVNISCSAPVQITCNAVEVTPTTGGTSFEITVSGSAIGNYPVVIQGEADGSLFHSQEAMVRVTDFTLSLQGPALQVKNGTSESTTISLTALNTLPAFVSLTCENLPPAATCNLAPSSIVNISPGTPASVTVEVGVATGTTLGDHPITIRATTAGLNTPKLLEIPLTVLTNPTFHISTNQTRLISDRSNAPSASVAVTSQDSFSGTVVFSCSVQPAGPTCSLSSSAVTSYPSSVTVAVAHNGAAPGNYQLKVEATGAGTTRSLQIPYQLVDYQVTVAGPLLFYPGQSSDVLAVWLSGLNGWVGNVIVSCELTSIPEGSCSTRQDPFAISSSPRPFSVTLTIQNKPSSGGTFPLLIHSVPVDGGPVRTTVVMLTVRGFTLELGALKEQTILPGSTTQPFDVIFKPYNGFDLPVDFQLRNQCIGCILQTPLHLESGAPEQNLHVQFEVLKTEQPAGGDFDIIVQGFSTSPSDNLGHEHAVWSEPLRLHVQDYALTVNPEKVLVIPGRSGTFTVSATRFNGFDALISIGCPAQLSIGVTCQSDRTQLLPGEIATFTITAAEDTVLGFRRLTIPGLATQDGTELARSVEAIAYVLNFDLDIFPTEIGVPAGGAAIYYIEFSLGIFTVPFTAEIHCLDLPPGVSCINSEIHFSGLTPVVLETTAGVTPQGVHKVRFSVTVNGETQIVEANLVVQGSDSLILTSPNGNELWPNGAHDILWNYQGNPGPTVRLELWNNGVFDRVIATNVALGSNGKGVYTWSMPNGFPFSQFYKLKIISESNSAIYDLSDVRARMGIGIDWVKPRGGETFYVGAPILTTATHAGIGMARVELLKGGQFFRNLGDYGYGYKLCCPWEGDNFIGLPDDIPGGTDYTFKIYPVGDPSRVNTTGNVTIVRTGIQLLKPEPGEIWIPGSTHTIQWSFVGDPVPPAQDLRISLNGFGVSDYVIAPAAPIGTSGTGSMQWTVPHNLPAGKFYKVTLDMNGLNFLFFQSQSQEFTIGDFRSVTVAASTGGVIDSLWTTHGVIHCSSTNTTQCRETFPIGYNVTLQAQPLTGYIFQGWTGACSGTGPCSVTVTQDLSVGASFGTDPNFDFTINAPTATATTTRGGVAEYNLSFAPVANMSHPLTFGCIGLPSGANCSFDPSSAIPGTQPVNVRLRVFVPSFLASGSAPVRAPFGSLVVLPFAVGLVWVVIPCRSRKRRNVALAVLVIGFAAVQFGCGGGGGMSPSPNPPPSPPPARSFSFQVVANCGSVQKTTTLTLNVQ
jgi:uncharacterized repeat protein (TIGR02543 family)